MLITQFSIFVCKRYYIISWLFFVFLAKAGWPFGDIFLHMQELGKVDTGESVKGIMGGFGLGLWLRSKLLLHGLQSEILSFVKASQMKE